MNSPLRSLFCAGWIILIAATCGCDSPPTANGPAPKVASPTEPEAPKFEAVRFTLKLDAEPITMSENTQYLELPLTLAEDQPPKDNPFFEVAADGSVLFHQEGSYQIDSQLSFKADPPIRQQKANTALINKFKTRRFFVQQSADSSAIVTNQLNGSITMDVVASHKLRIEASVNGLYSDKNRGGYEGSVVIDPDPAKSWLRVQRLGPLGRKNRQAQAEAQDKPPSK